MSKRLFTFGCSVTKHIWPTWADIVIHSATISGYSCVNAGLSGTGNKHIKQSFIRCDEKYHITDEDLLLVMWSSWFREDRVTVQRNHNHPTGQRNTQPAHFTREGNVLNSVLFKGNFVQDHFNIEHYILNCISDISMVRKAYQLTFEGSIPINEGPNTKPGAWSNHEFVANTIEDRVWHSFQHELKMPNIYDNYTSDINWMKEPQTEQWYKVDGHPVPAHALAYVQQYVAPHLPFPIHPETIEWVTKFNNHLFHYARIHGESLANKTNGQDAIADSFMKKMQTFYEEFGVDTSVDVWETEPDYAGGEDEPDTLRLDKILAEWIKHNNG